MIFLHTNFKIPSFYDLLVTGIKPKGNYKLRSVLIVTRLLKKFPPFKEPEVAFPCSVDATLRQMNEVIILIPRFL
jgi:hypothetical protein